MMANEITEVGEFFNGWAIYRKVLENNYMYHQEIYQAVGPLLRKHLVNQPFKLLDLGCGDACFLAETLEGMAISQYTGFDLSDSALALAATNLATLNCDLNLTNIDLMTGLTESTAHYDVIFSSFALHHLTNTEKAEFFQLAYERLQENGMLLLIDTMRGEDEDLPLYLDRYCGWLRSEWKVMQLEELDAICDHIRNNDFPETVSELSAMATYAGFSGGFELNQFRWHRTWCFQKT